MLNIERWVDPRVACVRAADLRAYVESHGWTQKPFPRPPVLLYEGPLDDDGKPITLWVPATEKPTDYRDAVVRIITNLSVLEDRHPVEVLNDILNHPAATDGNGAGATAPAEGAARP